MISVLYVDDERALLEVGRIFLEKEGEFTVGIALSAKAALESPDFSSYDIIVSDYQMPGMDGIAFLKYLRASGNTIPFILFTGKGREEVVIEAINNGADFYLQKGGQPQAQFAELAHKIRLAVRKRKTETDLIWSEEKFSRLFRENPSLEAITDFSTGSLIDVNDAFIRTTGYSRDNVIGRSARELGIFIDHQDRERMADAIAKDGIIRNIETRIQTKNGEIRILDFTGQHIRIADKDILFSQAVDITDRRRAEEELKKKNEELNASYEQIAAAEEELRSQLDELTREQAALQQSEAKYRELADLLPQMLFEIDREFRIIYINRYALSLFRITENELEKGVTIFDFIAPEDHDKVRQNAAKINGTGPVVAGQYTAVRRDGSRFPVLVYASPVFQHNTLTGFRGVVMDISGQKSLEDELRNREATFRKIFEMSPYPAAINSVPDYQFVAINKAFVEASGFTEEEVLGKNHLELGIISIPEAAKLIARFTISSKLENVPLALTAKDGKRVHVIFSTVPITFKNRPAILTMTAEVTQLRRIEEELIRKNEELHAAFEQLSATQEELNQNYSELTKSEQAIRASEAKFRALIEHTLDGILITDFTGNFYFVNRAACRIVDVDDPGVVIGKRNVMEFIAPESRDEVMRDFAQVAQGIDAYLALYKIITDRKRDVWIESIGKKIPYDQGEAILISIRDVTGRKNAESAIQAMVRSMVGTTGDDSLKKITESVSALLKADCVMIGEIQPDHDTVRVLSMILDGRDVPDFTYTLKGTPCENVEKKGFCLYPDNAIQLFPASKDLVELNIRGYVGTPLRNSRGEVMGILCALSRAPLQPSPAMREIMDIIAVKAAAEIERGRVERALRESESKLRRLAENAPDMIYRMSLPDGRFEYVSPASVALTGYTPEEFYADAGLVRTLIHPTWREYFREQWEALLAKNVPPVYEYQIIDRQQKVRWLNQRNMLITDETGTPVAIEGIVSDITRQKETEQSLQRSEQRSLIVSENAGSWIWEVDPEGIYRYSSPAVEKILGYKPDEIVGRKHYYDLFEPDMREDLRKVTMQAFERREPFHDFVNVNVHKNGNPVILETSGTPLFNEDGTFTGYCGVDEDITERKRIEEALKRTNHQLNLLTGITRHDILNKITVVLGYLAIARKNCTDAGICEYLQKMADPVEAIRQQIDFTRVYQNIGSQEPRWLVLDQVLPHAYVPVTITMTAGVGGIEVFADIMLEKVFFNLLDNSVRHGQRVTQIRVSATISGGDLVILWEDNGVGIPHDEKDLIFERGYGKNTGLGLFLAREVLALTGIAITETGTPGRGARFEILVPKGTFRNSGKK